MKKQIEIDSLDDFEVGDVIVPNWVPGSITVERDIPVEYKYGMTIETEEEFEEAPNGSVVIDKDGDAWLLAGEYWSFDGDYRTGIAMANAQFAPFTMAYVGGTTITAPEAPAVEQASGPRVTREQFIEAMTKVADDNDLHVGPEYTTAVVYAADRLGLR